MADNEMITITEAARRLKVSERTVYRMMKTGVLARVYRHDSVRLMSDDVRALILNRGEMPTDDVSQPSESSISPLQGQLDEKDAQIAQLLARQREMSQMLERLQAQLYELTRYVLDQAQSPPTRGFDWAFWRKPRRKTTSPPEEHS